MSEEDFVGHETYESVEEMHQTYRSYYGNRVNADTELKIVRFKLLL